MFRKSIFAMALVCASGAAAELPVVATDVAPVHSLVAQVMDGVGEPALIIRPGASPHGYAMRPSEARALQSADLVVWMGEDLTPWLTKSLDTLAPDAARLELLDAPGTIQYRFRDTVLGEDDEHAHGEGHDDGHGDDDRDEAHDTHEDHAHQGLDPHAWLDPENARTWVTAIAEALAAADPDNAETYRRNAETARQHLADLQVEIGAGVAGMKGRSFISFHDAYQYFEHRFGLQSSGTVGLGDARAPGPARLVALRDRISETGVDCAFSEPQFDTRLIEAVTEGGTVQVYQLDPVGAALEPGADLYPELLRGMARSFADCAAGS